LELLESKINLFIIGAIFVLAIIDLIFKKDLKSQIVSLGVLGTFIGIFIGLQDFNPEDMKNSINNILLGLKTAFFTSIIGMGTALTLSTFQKIISKKEDGLSYTDILLDISRKLDNLEELNNQQINTTNETSKVHTSINRLRVTSSKENQKLIEILDVNFKQMNKSLEQVIQNFNQELQNSFGDNFKKLNEAVINLVEWQNNYKTHIEHISEHLTISTSSIEKSKESLNIISSKNEEVLKTYEQLKDIIDIYHHQIEELTKHLKTYSKLSDNAENMFFTITKNLSQTTEDFTKLRDIILSSNQEQKSSFLLNNEEIKKAHLDLTQNIRIENHKQIESTRELFSKNRDELENITKHFNNLGEQIPRALQISLTELNRGLTSLMVQFQKDYKDIMDKYKDGINNER
jgi:uncharacterized protein YukE